MVDWGQIGVSADARRPTVDRYEAASGSQGEKWPVRLAGYFWALRCTLGHQLMVNILTYIIFGTTTLSCINNSITMLTYCHKVVACVDEVDCAIHCQVR